ncbi:MAG: phytoene desaturase family protein [Chloroflexota bacterium]
MSVRYDAIVVGGGHNGLVCAAYLGRAGMRVLVLERAARVGGALASDTLVPGARVPAYAHTVGRLAPAVARDLGLAGHGLRLVQPAVRASGLVPGAPPLVLWGDPGRTAAGLRARSAADADAWPGADAEVRGFAAVLGRLAHLTPPDPGALALGDLPGILRTGLALRDLGARDAGELLRVLAQPVADFLEDRFALPELRALLAVRGMRWSALGPADPGTTHLLLADAAGHAGGLAGETVYVRGGPGALADALAAAARAAGVTIRTGAPVARFRSDGERLTGVILADGEEIAGARVVSGLDPRTTLLDLTDPELLGPRGGWEAGNLPVRGVTGKVNLALAALPEVAGASGEDAARILRGRLVVAPPLRAMEHALRAVRSGALPDAPWCEATIPSLVDPLLVDGADAAGVRHVMSIVVQPVPAAADPAALADRVLATLEPVLPGLGTRVVARSVETPATLAHALGIAGGHPVHLEPGLDRWFAWRPGLGMARYRLPVPGLWLCASGAHPGGGVTGLPGRNAAREIVAAHRADGESA